MKKCIYIFMFCLLGASIASACSCVSYRYFCESINDNSHVVSGEILNKYEVEGLEDFDVTFYMDVLVIENILGNLEVDTISIVNSQTSCDLLHDYFEVGDKVILHGIDENRINDFSGHPSVSPGGCASTLLFLTDDGIVKGGLRSDLNSQSLDDFKSNIGACSQLTALDRWIDELEERLYIYPNPSSEFFFVGVSLRLEDEGDFELYDTVGQLMQKGTMKLNNQFKVDINNYPNGIYFLRLKIRDRFFVRKIFKN